MWRYQDHVLNEISEVVEATSKQHDNTQVDIAAAQRAKRKNVHIVFAKTYFSQGAFRFTAKSGFRVSLQARGNQPVRPDGLARGR